MRTLNPVAIAALLSATALSSCQDTTAPGAGGTMSPESDAPIADHNTYQPTLWSTPRELESPINLPDADTRSAFQTWDGHSLYFASIRTGGFGGRDLYVSHRAHRQDPWGPASNLGSTINSEIVDVHGDNHPNVTPDGHWLFFRSIRPDGCGGRDMYVSHRANIHDDLAWETPRNLGCTINTDGDDLAPTFYRDPWTHRAQLYFATDRVDGLGGDDFYVSTQRADGSWSSGVLVSGLSSAFEDNKLTLRADGLEAFFSSTRPATAGGEEGDFNIWTATRRSSSAPWGPAHLVLEGFGLPSLTPDAQTLYVVAGMAANPDLAGIFAATRIPPRDFQMELTPYLVSGTSDGEQQGGTIAQ